MNQSELKGAVEYFTPEFINPPNDDYPEKLKVLLDLAQQYLDIKGFPEERSIKVDVTNIGEVLDRGDCTLNDGFCREIGFNDALYLAKLAQMKKEIELKTIHEEGCRICLQSFVIRRSDFEKKLEELKIIYKQLKDNSLEPDKIDCICGSLYKVIQKFEGRC
jgi:hypothetical protein